MGQKKNCDIIHCEEIAPNGWAYCDAHYAMLYGGDAPIMVMNQLQAEIAGYRDTEKATIAEHVAEIASLHVGLKRVSDYNGRIEYQLAEQAAEIARLRGLLTRYRKEVPVGNQPHMICLEVDKALEVDR
jgi:hypothetical protein